MVPPAGPIEGDPMADPIQTQTAGASGATPPVSKWTKLAYGFGAVAYGVKNNGFDYFFLLFYSQVIGLDPRLAGLALTIALVVDAISDPIAGYWSDNFRSRWGRRHPFMYASAIPVSLSFYLLWTPPVGWSDMALFWYVLGLSITIRTFITFYETPSSALTPELSEDYDERSSLMSYRYYFGWTGGNAMTVLMFMAVFPAFVTAEFADGRFNRDSYALYGVITSSLIFLAIVISAAGTHARIPYLKPPPAQRSITLLTIFKEIFETLADKSFIALFGGALFGAIATGLTGALAFIFYAYFWEFDSTQTGLITLGVFGSAVIGLVLAPIATKWMGKKKAAISIGIVATIGYPLPIFLRLIGVMPENGEPLLFWIVFVAVTLDVGLIICFQILTSSMLADLVEQSELRTRRRSEGTFFAASTFIRKSVQGLGVSAGAMILYLAGIPAGAQPDEVTDAALFSLGAYYVPALAMIWGLMIVCIAFYRLDRAQHEDNLRQLAERNGE